MDDKEILTGFKSGALGREQAVALLTGAPAVPPVSVVPAVPAAPVVPAATATGRAVRGVPSAAPEPPPARVPATAPAGGGEPESTGPYAVTALHGRFPQADDLEAFWRTALDERDTASAPPPGRPAGTEPGYFLDGVAEFDAAFFGLAPDRAALLDPQERVLLETVWQTLEGGGYTGARLDALTTEDGEPRDVGVYLAHGPADHALLAAEQGGAFPAGCRGGLAGRLSAFLDLRGPSHCVDSGSSSFLVALHHALGALRAGECAAALVGAVDLRLHPARQVAGGGEGAGALLLRPLAAARAAGDTVHAVVRSGAVVHAGRAPEARVTERLDRGTAAAGADTARPTLRETGTTAAATTGDTGAATGFVALTRAVLQLRHGTLLPVPGGPAAAVWPRPCDAHGRELPRRAAVTVRDPAGTAAQVIVEEAPRTRPEPGRTAPPPGGPAGQGEELVLLSAPTPGHLAAAARRLAERVGRADASPDVPRDLTALARELRLGRAVLPCRLAVTVRSTAELAAALGAFAAESAPAAVPGSAAAPGSGSGAAGSGGVRHADLRSGSGGSPLLGDLPETDDYLAALWRGHRLDALARLWLAGVDVTAARAAGTGPVLPLPLTPLLRRPLPAARPRTDEQER
ncbi:beta-ketoacyl synthase N-terminal-like domain-containing protein [Streptomyces sp. NPDC003703]|uniref:beta-ketoacyl synthase N-terminal-like domain-containing protein n=1 Tax=Streptomyces sp. NPDC003283 TaxID=3364681 RepID=UPI003699831C